MLTIARSEGTWTALQSTIEELIESPEIHCILVLAGECNGAVPSRFNQFLCDLPIPVFGGVFPALIADGQRLESGNIVVAIHVPTEVVVVPTLSDASFNYDEFLIDAVEIEFLPQSHTILTFVDGLASRVGALIDSMFNVFGLQGNFIGGGAGSLSNHDMLCVITPQGVVRDAAVIAIPRLSSSVSVAHGWLPLAGPFVVTESDNNVIISLDWDPAFEMYRNVVSHFNGKEFDASEFSKVAQSYPFGIARLNAEFVVRDPLAIRADGGLICVGDVPRGSLVHIMNGDINTLLAAAEQVRKLSDDATPLHVTQRVDLFIDCISRALFMGDDINQELARVRNKDFPQIGAFTLGEIANSEREYLEFYNKTAVVATLWEP